jgi:hypothetical protein
MEETHTVGCEGASHPEWAEWVSMERYRLDVVSAWPPSPYKDAALAAVHSAIASLEPEPSASPITSTVMIRSAPAVVRLPLTA